MLLVSRWRDSKYYRLFQTYIGTSLVAVNPFKPIISYNADLIKTYGSKGIFQLPPHMYFKSWMILNCSKSAFFSRYGLANLAYQSLKNQSEDQCIILTGRKNIHLKVRLVYLIA